MRGKSILVLPREILAKHRDHAYWKIARDPAADRIPVGEPHHRLNARADGVNLLHIACHAVAVSVRRVNQRRGIKMVEMVADKRADWSPHGLGPTVQRKHTIILFMLPLNNP